MTLHTGHKSNGFNVSRIYHVKSNNVADALYAGIDHSTSLTCTDRNMFCIYFQDMMAGLSHGDPSLGTWGKLLRFYLVILFLYPAKCYPGERKIWSPS